MANFVYKWYIFVSILWLSYYRFLHKTVSSMNMETGPFSVSLWKLSSEHNGSLLHGGTGYLPQEDMKGMHKWMHADGLLNERLEGRDLRQNSRILVNPDKGIMAWTIIFKVTIGKKEQNQKSLENTSWMGEGADMPREFQASFLAPNLVQIWPTSCLCK